MARRARSDAVPRFQRTAARFVRRLKPELPGLLQCAVPVALFAVALARKRGLHTLFLTRFQIESVPLDFLDDVLLQNFTLEALQRVFQRFTVLNANFGQRLPPVAGQHETFMLPVKNTASLSFLVKDRNRPRN